MKFFFHNALVKDKTSWKTNTSFVRRERWQLSGVLSEQQQKIIIQKNENNKKIKKNFVSISSCLHPTALVSS